MANYKTDRLIAEYYRVMESLKGNEGLYSDLIDFTSLAYTPFIDTTMAKEMPIVIICLLCITKQPFYIHNFEALNIIKSRYSHIKETPGYIEAVRDSLEAGDELV
tara:strand:+ start:1435 stop:1749 length:315 start_codon:yes stop_codon:yes gene_type:complete